MTDIRQEKEWGEYLRLRGWTVKSIGCACGKHRLQVLIYRLGWWPFSILKLQRAECDPDFDELRKIKRKFWVINSYIEPLKVINYQRFSKAGYKKTKFPFLATKTVVVDLTKSKESLWNDLSSNAKRLIKKNEQIKSVTLPSEKFREIWRKSSKVWVLSQSDLNNLKKAYKNKLRIVASSDDKELHSGIILLSTKDCINYFQTWTNEAGRRSGAHYKLIWEEILRAKSLGKKFFDFEGIFDQEYPINKWRGFSEFKMKFGGRVIKHPGSFHRWF